MPVDVNIKCVKQKSKKINYTDDIFFLDQLNTCPNKGSIYHDNWFVYNAVRGIGYNLYLKESQDATYNFVDFKEKKFTAAYMKNMLQDKKKPSHGYLDLLRDTVVIFNEEYFDSFTKLIKEIISESAVSTCIIFFRMQVACPERYVGRISLSQFITLLKKEEIYLNTAYIISESDYD